MVDYTQNAELNPLISESGNNSSKIWIFLIVFLVIIIVALLIFFFIKYSSIKISDDELSQGTFMDLKENNQIKFEIDKEEHKIIIDLVYEDSIDIVIQSKTITANLKINEEKKFDLDEDGDYDLRVKLKSIDNGNVYLFIKKIDEEIKDDFDDKRKEILEKAREFLPNEELLIFEEALNDASTIEELIELENSIDDFLSAVETHIEANLSTCSELSGDICNQTEICNGTKINASDTNKCCWGDCILERLEPLDCGTDFNCFIDASEDCDLAQLYLTNSTDIFGIIITSTTFTELRGIESSKCIYYQKTESSSAEFSNELIQQLLNEGATQEEIDQAEQEANESTQNIVGTGVICRFDTNNLTSMLERWKDGNSTSGVHCAGDECVTTGDLGDAKCKQFTNHDENCHVTLSIHTPSLLNGGEGFAKVIGFSEENSVFWIIGNSSVATINPQQGSSTTITAIGTGNTNITATDTGIGTHCKASFKLEVL